MDPSRYELVHRIFDEARNLAGREREHLLDERCAGDATLRLQVEVLLSHDETALTIGMFSLAGTMVDVGQTIGRYKLLQQIGEGGFGVVYMAEQREPLNRRVALKVIKLGMDTKAVIARFEAERQALAMMDHPNIAKVFDAGSTETGRPYFVMELVRGSPATEFCDRRRLAISGRLELVVQVCDALQHAHRKGVIHRDIKPSNVLVGMLGDRPVPKIIDFGIAKATNARLTEKTVFTDFRQMIGTPEYMSPEQAGQSSEEADTRTDVYSTGVLLYELITGTTPFDSRQLRSAAFGEVQRIIREVEPPKPSARVSQNMETLATVAAHRHAQPRRLGMMIRGELDWIVMKSLEKDPSRRYESAGAMARDIQRFLDGEAIHAAPPSAAYRAKKFVRRNRGPVLAASLLVLALIAGLIGTSLGFFNASNQRDLARKEKDRADAAAKEARAAEAQARRLAYTANMLAACDAMDNSHFEQAEFFLDAAPTQLRGWEWDVLTARLDLSTRTVAAGITDAGPEAAAFDLMPQPDGRSFFTVHHLEDVAARQLDMVTGEVLREFDHPGGIGRTPDTQAVFTISPDGTRLSALASSPHADSIRVTAWDLPSGDRVMETAVVPEREYDHRPALSPDGTNLVLANGRRLWLQDVASGETRASGQMSVLVMAFWRFNRDGTVLAVADGRGGIELLDGHTLDSRATLVGHRNMVDSLDFSRDGRWLGSAAIDGTARIWDLEASPPTSVVLEHPQAVNSIRLSPDASLAATRCGDGAVRVWDARTGEIISTFIGDGLISGVLMFMPDGRTIASRHRDGTVRFWDVTAESTVRLRGHRGLVNGALVADRAGLIISVGWDGWNGQPGCVRFWDAESGDAVASWGRLGEIARYLAVSPDGRRAAAMISARRVPGVADDAELTRGVALFDLEVGQVIVVKGDCGSMAFDPTGELLAMGMADRLEIRSALDGSLLRSRESGYQGKTVSAVGWSPDARLVRCSSTPYAGRPADRVAQFEVLDAGTLETRRRFDTGPLSFTPGGKTILVRSSDGTIEVVDLHTWERLETIDEPGLHGPAFTSDGERCATRRGGEGKIVIWNAETWDRVASFRGPGFISTVTWTDDGSRLIGACGQTVCIWDATPIRERVRIRDERRAALEIMRPLVDRLMTRLGDPSEVIDQLDADTSLSPFQRRVAHHEVLRIGLARD